MSFLNPWVAAAIGATVLSALVLLYFLKLRRREQLVSSTLLWKRAVQDLQVNAPFQRLRKNLLLLLQSLVLLAGVVALARPVVRTRLADEKSVILLIDRSASMNAREGPHTRLDLAKEQAVRLVRTLNRSAGGWLRLFGARPEPTRAMVMTFSERAGVAAPFTANTSDLIDIIRAIQPTDGRSRIREALELAEAYMTPTRGAVEQTPVTPESASRLVLISDGCIADLDEATLRFGEVEYLPIGAGRDNVGITALRMQRHYEQPELLSVFAQVQNSGPQPVDTDVSLYVDGRLTAVQSLTLGPGVEHRPDGDDAAGRTPAEASPGAAAPQEAAPAGAAGRPGGPGDAARAPGGAPPEPSLGSLVFEFALERGAVVEVRLSRDDALAADNRAFLVVPPPRRVTALLVTRRHFLLESILRALPLAAWKVMTPEQYESAPAGEFQSERGPRWDVVIFDKHSTPRLPPAGCLFIGAVPQIPQVAAAGQVESFAPLWWDETHPVLRHVLLDWLVVSRAAVLRLPPEARTLIEGPQGPVLARYAHQGRELLLLSFAIEDTNDWALRPSFPVFMYNALRFLAGGEPIQRQPHRPGDALEFPVPADVRTARLTRPDGSVVGVSADAGGVVRYASTDRVGVYRVEPGVEGRDRLAVNLEDAWESDITPRPVIRLGGQPVEIAEPVRTATPEVWRWFAGAALGILLLEWYIYNRRVMV